MVQFRPGPVADLSRQKRPRIAPSQLYTVTWFMLQYINSMVYGNYLKLGIYIYIVGFNSHEKNRTGSHGVVFLGRIAFREDWLNPSES